jgi:hypothetical protein
MQKFLKTKNIFQKIWKIFSRRRWFPKSFLAAAAEGRKKIENFQQPPLRKTSAYTSIWNRCKNACYSSK